MHYLAIFFAGAFLCNSIPHLTNGLSGVPFPSPFSTPRGVGDSSPLVNVLWGLFNVFFGLHLLLRHPFALAFNADCAIFIAGALAIGIYLAVHFGKVRAGKSQ